MSSDNGMLDTFTTFGDLLKYLRVRARLTQRDLSIAVGYSEAQISRQESNKRVPSEYALKALFVPALGIEDEPEVVARLLALAVKAREQDHPWVVAGPEETIAQLSGGQTGPHNLPRQLTSFIGREKEIAQVVRMVREHSLVTLTGAGGVGKTQLALHAAKELLDDFPDGVWLVELAPVVDPVYVAITIASIFQVHSAPGQRLAQTLREYFASRRLLLILDNCEHVIETAAELSTGLLAGCPNLSILATSREILDVEGEVFFRCPSLSLPDASVWRSPTPVLKRAETSEAVRLFVDRAAAASPGFRLTEKNALTIAAICRRLDGIPLAIELAAARMRLLSLDQIAGSMDDVFGLLAGGRRSVLPRHKTLKALIEWSYQLLNPGEQLLLRRLSIFAGGWTLEAAQALAGGDEIRPGELLARMAQLVDKSLAFVESEQTGENRYHMLETIRQFANERLQEAGEYQMARNQHLAFFTRMAEQANPIESHHFAGIPETHRLLKELDNIRVALKWAEETNIESGLRLGISFGEAAPLTISLEMVAWMQQLLSADDEERLKRSVALDTPDHKFIRGRALLFLGGNRLLWGLRDQATQVLLESQVVFASIGGPADFFSAVARMHLGTLMLSSDPEQSRAYLEASREIFCEMNETTYLAECDRVLAALNLYIGRLDRAEQFAEESLRLSREINKNEIAEIEYLGHVAFLKGNFDRAIELYDQMLEWSYKYEDVLWTVYTLCQVCWAAWAQGDNERLLQLCEEMRVQGEETGCTNFFLSVEQFQALMEWAQGAYDQAAERAEKAFSIYQREYLNYTVPVVYTLGRVALSRGQYSQAEQYFRQQDGMSDGPRWKWRAFSLHAFALLAAAQLSNQPGMAERAAVLFGAQEKLFHWLTKILSPVERSEYQRALAEVKAALGEDVFASAWARGQAMRHNEAFAFALAGAGEASAQTGNSV